jgi:hypothetical protein
MRTDAAPAALTPVPGAPAEGLEQWRNYEPWLGQLREALGDIIQRYPPQGTGVL